MHLTTGKDELRDYLMHPRGPWFEAKENKLILVQGVTLKALAKPGLLTERCVL